MNGRINERSDHRIVESLTGHAVEWTTLSFLAK